MTRVAQLENRSLLGLSGEDVTDFLQNLVTCDIESLSIHEATFGALLTPQGKILFDFFIQRRPTDFLLDVETTMREALAKRLTFYKLRADVTIEQVDDLKVFVSWDGPHEEGFDDPRLPALGRRIYAAQIITNATEEEWNGNRIRQGVAESGSDFQLEERFPHEVLMDQFTGAGVDFEKGCYVGQEVVSRMHHRGTARSRFVVVNAKDILPAQDTAITAAERVIGTMGSSDGSTGLAIVRLDRAKSAMDEGTPITADGTALSIEFPEFVGFGWAD